MLFSLAGAIISPKFFSKIVYVSTLSELAYYVPLTQIDIPAGVYKWVSYFIFQRPGLISIQGESQIRRQDHSPYPDTLQCIRGGS